MTEANKTSFLVIATVFSTIGAVVLASGDYLVGSILLLLAVGTLTLRGYLKQKGIIKNK